MKTKLEHRTLMNHDTRQPFTVAIHNTKYSMHHVKVEAYRRSEISGYTFLMCNVPIFTAKYSESFKAAITELRCQIERVPISRAKLKGYLRKPEYVDTYKKWMHERALKRAKVHARRFPHTKPFSIVGKCMEEILIIDEGILPRPYFKKFLQGMLSYYTETSFKHIVPMGMCELLHDFISNINVEDVKSADTFAGFKRLLRVYYENYIQTYYPERQNWVPNVGGFWFGGGYIIHRKMFIERRVEFIKTLLKIYE